MVNVYVNGEYVGTDSSVVGYMLEAVSDPSKWTLTLTKNEKIMGQYDLKPCPFCGGEAELLFVWKAEVTKIKENRRAYMDARSTDAKAARHRWGGKF